MSEWWDPQTGNTVGALLGSLGGGVLCGVGGALAGVLASRGRAKSIVVVWFALAVAVGLAAAIVGGVALAIGQPRHVWFGPLLFGSLIAVVMGSLLPIVLLRYRQAAQASTHASAAPASGDGSVA